MYKSFFNLKVAPFKLTPDLECFFSEGNRKAILDALIYAITEGNGLIKVIGEVGSGKTFLSRLLAHSLPSTYEVLYLINPRIPADRILYAIALELALVVPESADKVTLLHALHTKLMQLYQQGRRCVLLIDEAQTMPLDSLEEIRMLTNLETGQSKLLQMVLFGQPELDRHLNRHEVRQIGERIVHSFYLPRLNSDEAGRYLNFRMQHAGYQGAFPFSRLAISFITWKADGFLRRINILAEKCLLAAFARQSKKVNGWIAWQVICGGSSRFISAFVWLVFLSGAISLSVSHWPHFWPISMQTQAEPADLVVSDKVSFVQPLQSSNKPSAGQTSGSITTSTDQANAYSIQLLRLKANDQQTLQHKIKKWLPVNLHSQVFAHASGPDAFQLFLGPFASGKEAAEQLRQLPEGLQKNQPFIVKQATINKQYNDLAIILKN